MSKILIIDDIQDNLVSMSALLKNLIPDCSIIKATSGQQGIEKAREELPDIIILDVIMPKMDGYETCKRLKKDEITKNIPISMITAIKKNSQSMIDGLEAGADNFLQKPINPNELKAQIKVMLRIKKAEDIIRNHNKNLENSVQEGKDKFSSLIETTSNAINKANTIINRSPAVAFLWKNAENWPVEFVSDNVQNVLGYSKDDFIKGKISYSGIIHSEDIERVEEEVILNSKDKNIMEFIHKPYRVITKDGKTKWIDDRTNILRDKTGNITHYQGIILNITKHIKTEKTLKDAQSVLIQQEKMASLGGLAAGIAHEINNPLGFVMSNFRTLKKYIETIKKYLDLKENTVEKSSLKNKIDYILEDIDDLFKESTDGFDRISLIVDNMRKFSRVDNDNNKAFSNLNELIKNTLVIARNSYKYVAEIETHLSKLPDINCRTSEINQVLLNIIVNAAQAIEQQKRDKKGLIKIKTYTEDNMVCCIIDDDGPGIPQKYQKKVFDPFFTTKGIGKGTGLGLSISYDIIVNKHKGMLFVKTEEESGTTFIIKIPINIIT